MISKNNKKTLVSGILFIVALICYVLYQILFAFYITNIYGVINYLIPWENIIFTTICSALLIMYCFIFYKKKAGKIFCMVGVGAFSLLNVYFILSADGRFDFYVMSDILFLAITVFMIIAKIKINKGIYIAGTIVFIVYALMQFVAVIDDSFYVGGVVLLLFSAYLIAEFIAFFNLWLAEGSFALAKGQTTLTKNTLENDLIYIKKLLDDGMISEDEYNRKKYEILNKL